MTAPLLDASLVTRRIPERPALTWGKITKQLRTRPQQAFFDPHCHTGGTGMRFPLRLLMGLLSAAFQEGDGAWVSSEHLSATRVCGKSRNSRGWSLFHVNRYHICLCFPTLVRILKSRWHENNWLSVCHQENPHRLSKWLTGMVLKLGPATESPGGHNAGDPELVTWSMCGMGPKVCTYKFLGATMLLSKLATGHTLRPSSLDHPDMEEPSTWLDQVAQGRNIWIPVFKS